MRDGELRQGARTAHHCLLASLGVLLIGNLIHSGAWSDAASLQAAHILIACLGLLCLGGAPSRTRILAVTLFVLAVSAAAIVVVGMMSLDASRTVTGLLVASLGICIVMPWGVRGQLAAVAILLTAMLAGSLAYAEFTFTAFDVGAVVGVLVATVYIAHVLQRQRDALAAEQRAVRAHADALAGSEAVFRAMFEDSAHGMARFARDGVILEANEALAHMLGIERASLPGQRLFELIGDVGLSPSMLDDLSSGRCANYRTEYAFETLDGEQLWTQATVTCLRGLHDELSYLIALDDVNLRKQAERELESAKRIAEEAAHAKGRFLAVMSHEIRTPLNAVLGYNELLGDTELDDTQSLYVDTVENSGRHLAHLIDDILDFSKIEAGGLELHRTELDLHALLHDVVQLLTHQAAQKGLSLELDIDQAVPARVLGDAKRLRQIATNLVGNAIKFTQTGGVIVRVVALTESAGGPNIELAVEDTGIGIAADEQPHLFDAFAQANRTIAGNYGGTGLGLAITKQLAEAMGGGIEVDSEPGKGSVFRVALALPFALADAPVKAPPPPSSPAPDTLPGSGVRVLIADGDAVSRLLTGRMLAALGCQCTTVANGREAVDVMRRDPHPVLFADMHMPALGGIDASRILREELPEELQPFVIVASSVGAPPDPEAHRGLVDEWLVKPLRKAAVAAALKRAATRAPGAPAQPRPRPDTASLELT